MKRLGLLGGMSWESSVHYEQVINHVVQERLGGVASADLLIRSFNFADIVAMQSAGDWEEAGRVLAEAALHLERAGCDAIVICTNTMHKIADEIAGAVDVPLLHIADATAAAINRDGIKDVALLGTRYTMEQDFMSGKLEADFGLTVRVPSADDITVINDIIFGELCRSIVRPESKARYIDICNRLIADGAQGIIAGCTEIEMLIGPDDFTVPFYPTAELHARYCAEFALS